MFARTLYTAALFAVAATTVGAQSVRLAVKPDSKLWVEGTSNLHDWSCKTEKLDAAVEMDAAVTKKDAVDFPKMLQKVQVKVPVSSLKCGKDQMDKNLYKALKAETVISYIMATFEVVPGDAKDAYTVKTVGKLTISGVEKEVKMDVTAVRLADGSMKASGTLPILMTDYGIKPPTALLGTMKTGNAVKVKFELTVAPQVAVAGR